MMCRLNILFDNVKKRKEAVNIMLEYVKGNISTESFWNKLNGEYYVKKILIKNKNLYSFRHLLSNTESQDLTKLKTRIQIYWMIKHFFKNKKIVTFNIEEENYLFYSQIQSEWIDIEDEEFLNSIIKASPTNLSKDKRIKWCKNRILELFKYVNNPPEWLQNPEWPIVEGQPLIFIKQSHKVDDYTTNSIKYIFYNQNTKEEVVVEQFD